MQLRDLRDTFASRLFSAGVQLGYIARQLGHTSPVITAQHHAEFAESEECVPPTPLLEGEVPALLAERGAEAAPDRRDAVVEYYRRLSEAPGR